MIRVYFARRSDGSGPIKIGCTAYPEQRIIQLSQIAKTPISYLAIASAPKGFRDEGRLHRQFAEHRLHGEWFEPVPALLDAVAHVVAHGELPPAVEEDREAVMAARYLGGETLQQIGDDFDMTRERVRQILRASGVPSLGMRKRAPTPVTDFEREVAALYAEGVVPPREIQTAYGLEAHQLRLILQRTGTRAKGTGHYLRKHDAEAVAELYAQGLKVREIAEKLGLPHVTAVYRYLPKAGVRAERLQRRSSAITPEIIADYQRGAALKDVAARAHVATKSLRRHFAQLGVLRSHEESERLRINRRHGEHRKSTRQSPLCPRRAPSTPPSVTGKVGV